MKRLENQVVGEEEGPWYLWLPDAFGEKLAAMNDDDVEQLAKKLMHPRRRSRSYQEDLGHTRETLHEAFKEIVKKKRPSSKLLYWVEL